jgi:hypothetical protein
MVRDDRAPVVDPVGLELQRATAIDLEARPDAIDAATQPSIVARVVGGDAEIVLDLVDRWGR